MIEYGLLDFDKGPSQLFFNSFINQIELRRRHDIIFFRRSDKSPIIPGTYWQARGGLICLD
jgi:hypothetical protein